MSKDPFIELWKIARLVEKEGLSDNTVKNFRENLIALDEEYEELLDAFENIKLKVLLLGDKNSIFIRTFTRNFKLTFGNNVSFDVFYGMTDDKYGSNIFNIFNFIDRYYELKTCAQEFAILRKIKNYFLIQKQVSNVINQKYKKYDLVHIHYLHGYWCAGVKYLKTIPLISTIWGSDMYKEAASSKLSKYNQKRILDVSDVITVANERIKKDVIDCYGKKYEDKIMIATFGTPIDLAEYDVVDKSQVTEFKEKYGIPDSRVIVIVGSCARRSQHHLEILEALSKFRDRIFIVVPLTYGQLNLHEIVKAKIKEYDLDGVVLRDYLSNEEMVALKRISDITIFIPDTDAFSAFLMEALYAGSIVITGRWLPYDWIDGNGIYCHRINEPTVQEIQTAILKILENLEEEKVKSLQNKEPIKKLAAWQYRFKDWLKVYHKVLEPRKSV